MVARPRPPRPLATLAVGHRGNSAASGRPADPEDCVGEQPSPRQSRPNRRGNFRAARIRFHEPPAASSPPIAPITRAYAASQTGQPHRTPSLRLALPLSIPPPIHNPGHYSQTARDGLARGPRCSPRTTRPARMSVSFSLPLSVGCVVCLCWALSVTACRWRPSARAAARKSSEKKRPTLNP